MVKQGQKIPLIWCVLMMSGCNQSSDRHQGPADVLVSSSSDSQHKENENTNHRLGEKEIEILEVSARNGNPYSAKKLVSYYETLGLEEDKWAYWLKVASDNGDDKSTRDLIYFSLANGKCKSAQMYSNILFKKNSLIIIDRQDLANAISRCKSNPIGKGDWMSRSPSDN